MDTVKPVLFEHNVLDFSGHGLGTLADATSCKVSCEENGAYDLTMTYPIVGAHAKDLAERRIILAKPSPEENSQPFRIYKILRPMDGNLQVYAHHLSYDLNDCILKPISGRSLDSVISQLSGNVVGDCNFIFTYDYPTKESTDDGTIGSFELEKPMTLRAAMLANSSNNIASTYKGVWIFDGLKCTLKRKDVVDRGAVIKYGVNLIDLSQERSLEEVYTHVYPYWRGGKKNKYYDLSPIAATSITSFKKIYPLDLSSSYQKAPSDASMRQSAEEFIEKNELGQIPVNITASMVQLEKTLEYKNAKGIKKIARGDTVRVEYLRLGVGTSARITKTEFDVLSELYTFIGIGTIQQKLPKAVVKDREENKKIWWQATMAGKTATDYITEKDDGTVDFGTGNHKFTIKDDGLEFNGVRNNVSIWHNFDAKAFEPQTLNLDLSSFSTISIEFGSVTNGQLTSESGLQTTIAVVGSTTGKTTRGLFNWNYSQSRLFTTYPDRIVFQQGQYSASRYADIPEGGGKVTVDGVTLYTDNSCCVPVNIYGFM
nr:MAG TPA: tail protein [Caudoviricetes sp.]